MTLSVAFVAEGDAETRLCWSGLAQKFVFALRRQGVQVDVVDAQLHSWQRYAAAALTWHRDHDAWSQRFGIGPLPFALKSRAAARALARRPRYDAVIQNGATFALPARARRGAPLVIYADANVQFARRGGPFAPINALPPRAVDAVAARERPVYLDATRIWTTSQAAADSFATDFDVPRDRLRTIYAGANVEPEAPPARTVDPASPPLVLFVGKQHVRKGSPVLLEAFGAVRRAIPNAELHIVGAVPPGSDAPGVTAHGFVASDTPDGLARLRDLYRRATVFCMPSRYEPFGVVFLEAMLAGLPCIGTDRWAMPEIIADGETGWISPDGDAPALAACLIEALGDRQRCIEMGKRGRERVLERFTWDKVAERARLDLEQIVG